MTALDRAFDVLRIVVGAADDDQILDATRHEQLARLHEPQVTGSQERTFSGEETRLEHAMRFFGASPVTGGDARAADPDLPHSSLGKAPSRPGVDDPDLLTRYRATTADDRTGTARAGGGSLRPRARATRVVWKSRHLRTRAGAARDEQ